MLHLEIDPRSAVPAYRQLMDQVRYYVGSGALRPGDRLPSIRQLARTLTVNPTTVVRAYAELEHGGLIEKQHGRGVFVRAGAPALPREEVETILRRAARRLAVEAAQLGADAGLVLEVVRRELEGMSRKEHSDE